jgi:hypothetical protein
MGQPEATNDGLEAEGGGQGMQRPWKNHEPLRPLLRAPQHNSATMRAQTQRPAIQRKRDPLDQVATWTKKDSHREGRLTSPTNPAPTQRRHPEAMQKSEIKTAHTTSYAVPSHSPTNGPKQ